MKIRPIGVALFLAVIPQAVVAQNLPDMAGDALKKMTGGITGVLGAIFSPAESDFHSAVQEQRLGDALAIYEKNADTLQGNKDLAPDIDAVLQHARAGAADDLAVTVQALADMRQRSAYLRALGVYMASIRAVESSEQQYLTRWRILSDFQALDPNLAKAREERERALAAVRTDLATVYGAFPHEHAVFAEELGEPADQSKLFAANVDGLLKRIETDAESDAENLVKHTSQGWIADAALKRAVASAVWSRLSASANDAVGMVHVAADMQRYGLAEGDIPARPKVLVLNASAKAEPAVTLKGAFNGMVTTAAELERETDPYVVIYVSDSSSARNIIGKKEVASSFKSGTRSVPNPSYAVAQMDCQRAQSNYAAQQARNAIAPARGWGAVFQGIGEGIAGASAREICSQFASMSAYNEEDVFTPYNYTVTEVAVTKKVRGRILSVDPRTGVIESYPLEHEDKDVVKVAYGRKAEDETPLGDAISDAALEKLSAAAVELDGSALVNAAVTITPEPHSRGDLVALLGAPDRPGRTTYADADANSVGTAATGAMDKTSYAANRPSAEAVSSDPRMQSVVVVLNPTGVMGAGFYVEPTEILTNYHVIEGASTVEVRAIDGRIITGRLVKKDIGLDLALIHVDSPGPPVQFANTIVKVGQTVEAIGHPQGFFFSISRGIVSAIRQMKGVLAPGSDKALLIQTDAAINAGNSGGPLFVQDRVVGVNTIKFKGAQGLGFAVHYSEVLRFLSQ